MSTLTGLPDALNQVIRLDESELSKLEPDMTAAQC
jgi:hypothetical protein